MKIGATKIGAGIVTFAMQYRNDIPEDQGLNIQVIGNISGKETELLRFDCFDQRPHYHYGPELSDDITYLDQTTSGNPIGWTIKQLRSRLPQMLLRAGYQDISDLVQEPDQMELISRKLDEVYILAREKALSERGTVTHNRGDEVIEAGNIRFGLEFRELSMDRGLAIHVLGDVAGQEIELLAFDCFESEPHYHYGPRNKNIILYWDTTVCPDTLEWTLDQFLGGKLPAMINRAGYPGIVAELDSELILETVTKVVAPRALLIRDQNKIKGT